jgi:hypothetical protein
MEKNYEYLDSQWIGFRGNLRLKPWFSTPNLDVNMGQWLCQQKSSVPSSQELWKSMVVSLGI